MIRFLWRGSRSARAPFVWQTGGWGFDSTDLWACRIAGHIAPRAAPAKVDTLPQPGRGDTRDSRGNPGFTTHSASRPIRLTSRGDGGESVDLHQSRAACVAGVVIAVGTAATTKTYHPSCKQVGQCPAQFRSNRTASIIRNSPRRSTVPTGKRRQALRPAQPHDSGRPATSAQDLPSDPDLPVTKNGQATDSIVIRISRAADDRLHRRERFDRRKNPENCCCFPTAFRRDEFRPQSSCEPTSVFDRVGWCRDRRMISTPAR